MTYREEVQRRLRQYEAILEERKKEFKVLLLGPGWPKEAKIKYRDRIRKALKDEYDVHMVEDYTTKIPLDDKFVLIADGMNLIAVILVENGGREGVSWELGFLEGYARGFDKASGGTEGLKKLIESVIVFVQRGAVTRNLITRMITDGMLTKIEARDFDDTEDLIDDLKRVCITKLYGAWRPDLWP